MSKITWRTSLAGAVILMTCVLPLPGLALVDQADQVPDDYLVDLELIRLQTLLAVKGFYRGPVDGLTREGLADAVLAFHKAADLDRTTTWMPGDMDILSAWEPQIPDLPDQPDRLEVDLERQVMHLVNQGEVVATCPYPAVAESRI